MLKPVLHRSVVPPLCFIALALTVTSCRPASEGTPLGSTHRRGELREQLRRELGDAYQGGVPAATAAQSRRGLEIYEVLCSGCHGTEGQGDGPAGLRLDAGPPSFADAEAWSFFSDRARLEIIRAGAPGTAMIGWENMLDEEELGAVYAFVRSLSAEGAKGTAP